jgi:hypothetical protein
LANHQRFARWDLVEMRLTKARDGRPESYRVDEDSIKILESARDRKLSERSKVALWRPFIYPSLEDLELASKDRNLSLGIIRPEDVSFHSIPIDLAAKEDQQMLRQQASLFEEPLKPLEPPEYNFCYQYSSGGKLHRHSIQDWEVQAAFHKFKREYGPSQALAKLEEQYASRIPKQNLHFIMGNMAKRRWQFILIGLLRSSIDPSEMNRQGDLL